MVLEFEPLLNCVSRQARTLFLRSLESKTNTGAQKLPERPRETLAANILEPSWIARDAKQASVDQQVKKHERARNFIKRLQAPLRRAKKPSCPPFGFPHFPLLPPANQQRQWFGFWCWDSYFSVESDQQNFPKVCTKYCLLFPPCLSAFFFLPSPLSLLLACRNVKAPRHGHPKLDSNQRYLGRTTPPYTRPQSARNTDLSSMDSAAINYHTVVFWTWPRNPERSNAKKKKKCEGKQPWGSQFGQHNL